MQKENKKCHDGSGNFGKITVIGTGPGSLDNLSNKAVTSMKEAEVVIGYSSYLGQVEAILEENQEKMYFNMKDEIKRCEAAVEKSSEGKNVAMVSGGDAGIYGMSGLLLEILNDKSLIGTVPVEFIPGIPAFCAASCVTGAPIMNDFCVISLSNLLTPWDEIKKRLKAASIADFVIVIYNPKSMRRKNLLTEAKNILLEEIERERPVSIVKAVTRPDEEVVLTSLEKMDTIDFIGMNTTIIIGNSSTYIKDLFMITRRGYHNKYDYNDGSKI